MNRHLLTGAVVFLMTVLHGAGLSAQETRSQISCGALPLTQRDAPRRFDVFSIGLMG